MKPLSFLPAADPDGIASMGLVLEYLVIYEHLVAINRHILAGSLS